MANRAANAKAKVAHPDGRRTGLAVLFLYLPAEQAWCPVPSSDAPDPAEDELVLALDAALVAALWSDSGPGRRTTKKKLFPHLARKGRPTGLPADAVALRFAGDGARGREFEAALRSLVLSASERGWRPDDPVLPPLEAGTPREAAAVLRADDTLFFQHADEHGIAVGWVSVSAAARRRAGEYQRGLVYAGDWEELQDFLGREPLPLPEAGPGVVVSGEVADRSDLSARQGSEFQQLLRAIGTGAPADRERAAERLAKVSLQIEDVPSVIEAASAADQPDRVRVLLLRAAGTALHDALGGPEAVRQTVATKGLVILYQSDGEVRREAARLLLRLSEWDSRLRTALAEVALTAPAAAGGRTEAAKEQPDSEVLLATDQSRVVRQVAREQLRAKVVGAVTRAEEHPLVRELQAVTGETTAAGLQNILSGLEGVAFDGLADNQLVCQSINAALRQLGTGLVCTKAGCKGPPAMLRVSENHRTGWMQFKFDHGGKAASRFHGGLAVIPRLMLPNPEND